MTTSTSPVSSAPGQGTAWHTLTLLVLGMLLLGQGLGGLIGRDVMPETGAI